MKPMPSSAPPSVMLREPASGTVAGANAGFPPVPKPALQLGAQVVHRYKSPPGANDVAFVWISNSWVDSPGPTFGVLKSISIILL